MKKSFWWREDELMTMKRSTKRAGVLARAAAAILFPIAASVAVASAGTISVITFSDSQNSTGQNVGVNANIANGVPDPGNGVSGTPLFGFASGTTSGNQFADSASVQSIDGTGITSGQAQGAASLINATVHAYTHASNSSLFPFNASGYQSTARAHANWTESLTFQPLPGNPIGSLVPVTMNVFADTLFGEDDTLSAFTSFDYSVQMPDLRDNLGNFFLAGQLRWSSDQSSDGFGDTSAHNAFCLVSGGCFGQYSLSGTNGAETYSYSLIGGVGIMTDTIQGYAVSGSPFLLGMGLGAISEGDDAITDFSNTGWLTIDSPVSFTSQSGVFLSAPVSGVPEPATTLYMFSGAAAIVWLRRIMIR